MIDVQTGGVLFTDQVEVRPAPLQDIGEQAEWLYAMLITQASRDMGRAALFDIGPGGRMYQTQELF